MLSDSFFSSCHTFSLSLRKTKMLVASYPPGSGLYVGHNSSDRKRGLHLVFISLAAAPLSCIRSRPLGEGAFLITDGSQNWRSQPQLLRNVKGRFQVVWARAKNFLCRLTVVQLLGRTSGYGLAEIFPSVLAPPGGLAITFLSWVCLFLSLHQQDCRCSRLFLWSSSLKVSV